MSELLGYDETGHKIIVADSDIGRQVFRLILAISDGEQTEIAIALYVASDGKLYGSEGEIILYEQNPNAKAP